MRRLCYFYKIVSTGSPSYLFKYLPASTISPRYPNCFTSFRCRTISFQNSFFPHTVSQWNHLDPEIRSINTYQIFRNTLLKRIKPLNNSIYNIHDPLGIKLLCRLRFGFSHLREHKFRHNFLNTLNPMCSCSLEPETTTHFLLHCPNFTNLRLTLMSNLNDIDPTISSLDDANLVNLLLFGKDSFNNKKNKKVLEKTIEFLKTSLRFDESLF